MIGTAIGDIVGSIYEFKGFKTKNFPLYTEANSYTDDTVMAVAIADAIMHTADLYDEIELKVNFIEYMQKYGKAYPYPMGGYGGRFANWLHMTKPQPYNSWGNGSAMRAAACGWAADGLEHAELLARYSAEVTHNHPEGIKGAQCTAGCIWLAKNGFDKAYIRNYVEDRFYHLDGTVDTIRPGYKFNESCQETVPQAVIAFLDSKDFEDAIRNAVSLGGDSDTLAAITGGIAEAYYGVTQEQYKEASEHLDIDLLGTMLEFESKYEKRRE